uniref:RRM domain-containing protein n=1 Tax=Cannabis sativa TaxID=3483 RepID=A0A803QCU1_CANSA
MDEDGGEQMDQFHRNEAISAVADEGFLGEEEEDDDYEDLYNDVNVGEGFLQSMRKNEDSGFGNEYGQVKEVKFFDEKASGKSKGYCQVEFYDPAAATACKEGMNGHLFNGRPCLVAFASPFSVKRMGEAQVNRNQQMTQTNVAQARRPNDTGVKPGGNNIATGGNYQGADTNTNTNNNNRGFGRGNWGRGNAQNMGNRGPVGPMRNRGGGMSGRGIMGNGGNGFGQGLGATPPLLHPQSMMGQGFDPAFGAPMGRMGSYGGFPGAPTPPFSGILSSFPPVGGVGLPGVAPHVNPAFFGRGMPMNGMGMMPTAGVDGPNMGMWSDPSMGGWGGGEEHGGGRAAESSYGEEAASDHQYGEVSHDRGGGWPNPMKEKDRGSERDWSGSSDRRYREDRDQAYERDVPREKDTSHDDWDRYADHHRYRDRETEHDDEWERGRSSRTHNKGRVSQEDDHRSRSRDADYGKRRRLTSE